MLDTDCRYYTTTRLNPCFIDEMQQADYKLLPRSAEAERIYSYVTTQFQ